MPSNLPVVIVRSASLGGSALGPNRSDIAPTTGWIWLHAPERDESESVHAMLDRSPATRINYHLEPCPDRCERCEYCKANPLDPDGSPDCRCETCPAGGPYTCIDASGWD